MNFIIQTVTKTVTCETTAFSKINNWNQWLSAIDWEGYIKPTRGTASNKYNRVNVTWRPKWRGNGTNVNFTCDTWFFYIQSIWAWRHHKNRAYKCGKSKNITFYFARWRKLFLKCIFSTDAILETNDVHLRRCTMLYVGCRFD